MRDATVVQQLCKSCRACFMFYCMFYFTSDRTDVLLTMEVGIRQKLGAWESRMNGDRSPLRRLLGSGVRHKTPSRGQRHSPAENGDF